MMDKLNVQGYSYDYRNSLTKPVWTGQSSVDTQSPLCA